MLVQVETGQMSAAETGQMSAVETRQMSTIKTGLCPVAILYICLVSTADICPKITKMTWNGSRMVARTRESAQMKPTAIPERFRPVPRPKTNQNLVKTPDPSPPGGRYLVLLPALHVEIGAQFH